VPTVGKNRRDVVQHADEIFHGFWVAAETGGSAMLQRGIHHVTAIAGPARHNLGFYVGALGLRLVKKTVNFDDPRTYHL
jgi:hypothetical protein